MKNLITLTIGILVMSFSTLAKTGNQQDHIVSNNNGTSYIFTEHNIEFSVFPDGQFDFVYVGGYNDNATVVSINSPNVSVSFNAGHDYDMYVQYDNYGAVIQIEDLPIYYDTFGRITQAGSVDIRYNNRRIVSVGGMYIHYNRRGYYSHYSGFINSWNTYYVYRPWHVYYARPFYNNCIVYDYAYRTYYTPVRYSFHDHRSYYRNRGHNNHSYSNGRRSFHRPGSRVHHRNGRVATNRDYKPSRRNTAATLNKRRGTTTANTSNRRVEKKEKVNSRRVATNNKPVHRGRPVATNNTVTKRKGTSTVNRKRTTVNRKQAPKKGTVTMRSNKRQTVSRTPVKRNTNSPKKVARTTTKRTASKSKTSRSKGSTTRRARG